jgi:hypothetical protein
MLERVPQHRGNACTRTAQHSILRSIGEIPDPPVKRGADPGNVGKPGAFRQAAAGCGAERIDGRGSPA